MLNWGRIMPGSPSSGEDYSEMDTITSPDSYVNLSVIGNGAYGTVYKARHISNPNLIVAIKKIRLPLTEEGIPTSTLREIATLRQLETYEHPNIIRLLDVCHGKTMTKERQIVLYLVFEHCDQDLATYMAKCPLPGLHEQTIKNLMYQILCGIDFLHSHRILHRDLKPQNLLITHNGIVKLADFGLAKTYDFQMRLTSVVVTLWYRSPEVLLGCPYATPVDIWSVGCIMAEMIKRRPLFAGSSEGDQLDKIFRIIGTPNESEWPKDVSIGLNSFRHRPAINLRDVIPDLCERSKHLLQHMLLFDACKRITAAEALRHDYFNDCEYAIPICSTNGQRDE
ncbi:cyclin-dependent kinase 4 isoform X1 [Rhodnius prolixus]|uniref:cyclin-dependent kinase 4 isoform X1 n=2 Tax=Rhodnius prolixus TaxID=13249 RepID=UPI003D18EBFC